MSATSSGDRETFNHWLRTGRWIEERKTNAVGLECKFNPWHDPENGQFTFANQGRHYGNEGRRAGGDRTTQRERSFGGGGATGQWSNPSRPARQRIGAKPNHPPSKPAPPAAKPLNRLSSTTVLRPTKPSNKPVSTRISAPSSPPFRSVSSNGYTFEIDNLQRTRSVSGEISMAKQPQRSRRNQRAAGGSHRRPSDDGGHYIAARFNGPTEAFNHFAQDANFNRGGYRQLEEQWAKAKRANQRVTVKILPSYEGSSRRPSSINVWFTIGGNFYTRNFPNERKN